MSNYLFRDVRGTIQKRFGCFAVPPRSGDKGFNQMIEAAQSEGCLAVITQCLASLGWLAAMPASPASPASPALPRLALPAFAWMRQLDDGCLAAGLAVCFVCQALFACPDSCFKLSSTLSTFQLSCGI